MLSKPLGRILAGVIVVIVVMVAWFLSKSTRYSTATARTSSSPCTKASRWGRRQRMHAQGVIASPLAFNIDTTLFGSFQVAAGSYEIAQGSSFSHVRSIFSGPPNVVAVDVLAGQTLHEVANNIVADGESAAFGDKFVDVATATHTSSPFLSAGSLEGLSGQVSTSSLRGSHHNTRHVNGKAIRQAGGLSRTDTVHDAIKDSMPISW